MEVLDSISNHMSVGHNSKEKLEIMRTALKVQFNNYEISWENSWGDVSDEALFDEFQELYSIAVEAVDKANKALFESKKFLHENSIQNLGSDTPPAGSNFSANNRTVKPNTNAAAATTSKMATMSKTATTSKRATMSKTATTSKTATMAKTATAKSFQAKAATVVASEKTRLEAISTTEATAIAEAQAKAKTIAEAQAKAAAEAKAMAIAEAQAKATAEAEAKAIADSIERAIAEAEVWFWTPLVERN